LRKLIIMLSLLLVLTGCGGKDLNLLTDSSDNQTESPGYIGTLDEVLAGGVIDDTDIDKDDDTEKYNTPEDIVVIEKRNDESTQNDEIQRLSSYTIELNGRYNTEIDNTKSSIDIKEIKEETDSINTTIISVNNIGNEENHIEIDLKTDSKYHIDYINTRKGIRYTIYTAGNVNINDIEIRLYNDELKSHYRVINTKELTENINNEQGEVIYGDIVKIGDNLFTVLDIKEIKSSWVDGAGDEDSIASRTYRLTVQNINRGPQRVLVYDNILRFRAVDNTGAVYQMNTDIIERESNGNIRFDIGEDGSGKILTKYSLDNKEYIDIIVEVSIKSDGKIPREEIVKADTIIKETAHNMFIAYESEDSYWVTTGLRN